MASDSVLLLVDPHIYVPNAIAPGSGQGNDRFMLFSKEPHPIHWLKLYDRWGMPVFEQRDLFTNDSDRGWDGMIRGKQAQPGIYVFQAEVEIEPGRTTILHGDVLVSW